jgi:hypothetical protein
MEKDMHLFKEQREWLLRDQNAAEDDHELKGSGDVEDPELEKTSVIGNSAFVAVSEQKPMYPPPPGIWTETFNLSLIN